DTKPINHGVVIVGWDDSMCGGEGAWMVKNSWGTNWGDEGVAYMKYGTSKIGMHSQWFEYSDHQPDQPMHYGLFMPDTSLDAGDMFILERRYGNPDDTAADVWEFLFLDVYGHYWFYPCFSQTIDWTELSVGVDQYRYDVILAFEWPEHAEGLAGLRFWGGFLDADTGGLLAWDMVEWGS
ncbi:hypothetical protein JW979_14810, partial [bacterium]|nr:hypothetical protein [candidate division CSSED10-310 bacterium]